MLMRDATVVATPPPESACSPLRWLGRWSQARCLSQNPAIEAAWVTTAHRWMVVLAEADRSRHITEDVDCAAGRVRNLGP